jgi:hypothetical protein
MSLILDFSSDTISVKNGGAVKLGSGGLSFPEAPGTDGQLMAVVGGALVFVNGFSGSFSDLTGVPATFPPAAHVHAYSSLTGVPTTFAPAPHVHSYLDLTDKPTIPVVPTLAAVATSGSYTDLLNKPTIPAAVDTSGFVQTTALGVANGVATLGSDGKLTAAQLPAGTGGTTTGTSGIVYSIIFGG